MRPGKDTDHCHAGRDACLNAGDAILKHDGACGVSVHRFGGMEENVRMRFSACNLRGAEHFAGKHLIERQYVETQSQAVRGRRRRDAALQMGKGIDVGPRTMDRTQLFAETSQRS